MLSSPPAKVSTVEVHAVGICGSEMHAYHGHDARRKPPLVMGHEISGVCLDGPYFGQKVAVNPLITCGECQRCLHDQSNLCDARRLIGMDHPGGMAERVLVPNECLIPVPADADSVHLALAEPAATALHGVKLAMAGMPKCPSDMKALVLGGGSIGLLSAAFLKKFGCTEIFLAETNGMRMQVAAVSGYCEAYNPLVSHPWPDSGLDVVIDAVGVKQTRAAATRAIGAGGRIVHVGLGDGQGEFDFRKLTLKEVALLGSYTYSHQDVVDAVEAILDGSLGDLSWVESRPLSEGSLAFQDLHEERVAAPKIVLRPCGL